MTTPLTATAVEAGVCSHCRGLVWDFLLRLRVQPMHRLSIIYSMDTWDTISQTVPEPGGRKEEGKISSYSNYFFSKYLLTACSLNPKIHRTRCGSDAKVELISFHSSQCLNVYRLRLRLWQGCGLAHCIACGSGNRVRRQNKISGKLSKLKVRYLGRSFSTVANGFPLRWSSRSHLSKGRRKTRY